MKDNFTQYSKDKLIFKANQYVKINASIDMNTMQPTQGHDKETYIGKIGKIYKTYECVHKNGEEWGYTYVIYIFDNEWNIIYDNWLWAVQELEEYNGEINEETVNKNISEWEETKMLKKELQDDYNKSERLMKRLFQEVEWKYNKAWLNPTKEMLENVKKVNNILQEILK